MSAQGGGGTKPRYWQHRGSCIGHKAGHGPKSGRCASSGGYHSSHDVCESRDGS